MENYDLEEDEVVLYKGFVKLSGEKAVTELILTNINFVFITKLKKLFAKEEVQVDTYPVNEIKFYKGEPWIKRSGQHAELYFRNDEVEFDFVSKGECRKFVSVALNLITNKNTFERGVEKVKETIAMVDNSVGVDNVVKVAGLVAKKGYVGKAVSVAKQTASVVGKGVKAIGKIKKND